MAQQQQRKPGRPRKDDGEAVLRCDRYPELDLPNYGVHFRAGYARVSAATAAQLAKHPLIVKESGGGGETVHDRTTADADAEP